MNSFQEVRTKFVGFEEIQNLSHAVADGIAARGSRSIILVMLGRGGWLPGRMIGGFLEAERVPVEYVSLILQYRGVGTPEEKPVLLQGMDASSASRISQAVEIGGEVWLIDAAYSMGHSVALADKHMCDMIPNLEATHLAVVHWIRFGCSPHAWWRVEAKRHPDLYGALVRDVYKTYVVYPWEVEEFST